MNLALTADQQMIRDAAHDFLAEASAAARVRAAIDAGGFDAELWRGIGELGWCGVAIDEAFGGMGLGPPELVLVVEQMGRHLACAPFFGTVALAGNLLGVAGNEEVRKAHLPRIAAGRLRATAAFDAPVETRRTRNGWIVSGRVDHVVDGADAELLLLATRRGIFAIEAGTRGLRTRPLQTWDGTRRFANLVLANVAARRVDDPARRGAVARAWARARLYLAAEQLGGAQQCLDLTLRYISERRQFGRPIASFQAVKHRCAQMMVKVEGLRSLVYGAAANEDPLECDAARALAADTFFDCAAEAIQLHGGVGFTWEFAPHLYFKRAQATSHWLGAPPALREQLAQALL